MSDTNKVLFGLEKVHYAIYNEDADTYQTPVAWPGAVSLSLDAEGDTTKNYADDGVYFVTVSNNGYSGDYESAMVPESFLTDVMGFTKQTNGAIVEYSNQQPKSFALLFQFKGDVSERRHVLYNCKMTRTSISSETTQDSIEMKTVSAKIDASPRTADGAVKAHCDDSSATCYANWFTAVVKPAAAGTSGASA